MAGFIYFVPGWSGADERKLRELGLADRLGREYMVRQAAGPDGRQGLLMTRIADWPAGETMGRLRYDAEKMAVQRTPWGAVMMWRDAVPGPADLLRPERGGQPLGRAIELADGRRWHVAALRSCENGTVLAWRHAVKTNEAGEWETRVREEDRPLADLIERVMDMLIAIASRDEPGVLSAELAPEDELTLVEAALGANYRVAREEIGLLELLSVEHVSAVAGQAMDVPRMLELMDVGAAEKKKGDGT